MTFEAKCKIEDQVIAMFNKAIGAKANRDIVDREWCAHQHHGINWNFIDSDIHIGVKEAGLESFFDDLDDFIESMMNEWIEFGVVEMNSLEGE